MVKLPYLTDYSLSAPSLHVTLQPCNSQFKISVTIIVAITIITSYLHKIKIIAATWSLDVMKRGKPDVMTSTSNAPEANVTKHNQPTATHWNVLGIQEVAVYNRLTSTSFTFGHSVKFFIFVDKLSEVLNAHISS